MPGLRTGVPGAIEMEGRNVTAQPACNSISLTALTLWPKLGRTLARDSECAIKPGSKPSGVVVAETLQELVIYIKFVQDVFGLILIYENKFYFCAFC